MARKNDLKQIENLYQYILTEKKIKNIGGILSENAVDDLIKASKKDVFDPRTAQSRDAEFNASIEASKDRASQSRGESEKDILSMVGNLSKSSIRSTPATVGDMTAKRMTAKNMKQIMRQIEVTYQTNLRNGSAALILYGASGIGKSDLIRQVGASFAEREQRELVFWANASTEKRTSVFENPHHFYVISIMNAGQLQPEKWSGIPDMFNKTDFIEERPYKEIGVFMLPGISGMLFLDEMNHANEEKMNALFSVVLEKRAGSRALASNRLMIMAAGNLGHGHAVEDVPGALVNRIKSFWLVVSPEDWFEWAEKSGINSLILAFVKSDPGHNFYGETDPNQNDLDKHVGIVCPRNFQALSEQMTPLYEMWKSGKYNEMADVEDVEPVVMFFEDLKGLAEGLMGDVWASYWISFLRYYNNYGKLDVLTNMESKTLAHYYAAEAQSSSGEINTREVLNIIAGIVHYLHNHLVKALDHTGMLTDKKVFIPEFTAIIRPDEKEKQLAFNKRFAEALNTPNCNELKEVIQAIANVTDIVLTTDKVGSQNIDTSEIQTMVINKVCGGFTSSQKKLYIGAIANYKSQFPKVLKLRNSMSQYVEDAGLKAAISQFAVA